ncbi:MAG: hypothetical protein R2716_11270 [Microthrixaceae bacterium]
MSLLILEAPSEGSSGAEPRVGLHAQDTAELFFNDVRVPAQNLLGNEGEGFMLLVKNRLPGRLSIAAGTAVAAPCSVWTTDAAKRRQAFG